MTGILSIEQLRELRPLQYRRWVRSAAFLVMGAYGLNFCAHIIEGTQTTTLDLLEPALSLIALVALIIVQLGYERLASWILLVSVGAEFATSLLVQSRGQSLEAAIGLCALITGVGLLLGARVALIWSSVMTLIFALPLALGLRTGLGSGAGSIGPLVAAGASMHITALLLRIFQHSFAEVVELAQRNEKQALEWISDSPDGVIGLSHDERVLVVNRAACHLLRRTEAEVLGQYFADLPLQGKTGSVELDPLVGKGLVALTSQEGKIHIEARARSRGPGIGWMVVLRDVTDRDVAEVRARELSEQLQHAQKMEAVGRLAGGIAHDFNNLLMVIGGHAELLMDSSDEETKLVAREQFDAFERCAALTKQLLGFARKDVVQRRPIELCDTIASFERLLLRLLGEEIILDLDLRPPCPTLADPGQIEQIVMNLAANARDAMPNGGTLSIRCFAEGERTILELRDTGGGISPEVEARMFEPFFTTKERGKGTGLGLSTVSLIVKEHEGKLQVRSVLGEGTAFFISLPRTSESPVERANPQSQPRHARGTGTILVVDDVQLTREVVCRQLIRSGFRVHSATSGAEALGLLRDGSLKPDLLITDVLMPAMTGPELAQRALKMNPTLPVIYMSGYPDDVLDIDAIDVKSDLLLKPFSRQALVEKVNAKLA